MATDSAASLPAFLGVLDPVLVEFPAEFDFSGSILRPHAAAAWDWISRDMFSGRSAAELENIDADERQALLARIEDRMRAALPRPGDHDAERHLRAQLGGEEALLKLPAIVAGLKARSLIANAAAFGRAINTLTDDDALAAALRAVPFGDKTSASWMMQAAIGQVLKPSRLVTAAIRLSGAATETSLLQAGYGPLVEAMLCHAQNQIPILRSYGPFADGDLACRAVERYHRLVRGISGYVELGRQSRWSRILAALTSSISEQIEPRLEAVPLDVAAVFRTRNSNADRVDSDQVLAALNGLYLLATVRACRTTLAVNHLFDQTWAQVGQMLELLLTRALDSLRLDPDNLNTRARLDAGITMAEIRFNSDYASVIRQAKEKAEQRCSTP